MTKDEAFLEWYNNAHWGNEDLKECCHRSWNAAIKQARLAPAQEPVAWEQYAIKFAKGRKLTYGKPENLPSYIGVRALVYADNTPPAAQEDIQRLSALVRAQQITIDKLEQARSAPVQEPVAHCTVRPLRGDESYPKTEIIWVKGKPIAGPLYTTPPAAPVPDVSLIDEGKTAAQPTIKPSHRSQTQE